MFHGYIIEIRGQGRVINYVGIVRGGTQKLIKEELHGVQDDKLIERLDSILDNLRTGKGEHDLKVLQDKHYLELLDQVQQQWTELKGLIWDVRQGEDQEPLFDSSQNYFVLVNDTVFAAEDYSDAQVRFITFIMIGINSGLIFSFVMSYLLTVRKKDTVTRKADMLGEIAYIDPMTQINNRARCEQLIHTISATPSTQDMAVVMFDMNNLKSINDTLGHKSGDDSIVRFAHILDKATKDYGFIGRYGGDEFIAILENAGPQVVQEYLEKLSEEVLSFNILQLTDLEELSFATGYCIGNLQETSIDELIYHADRNMYENKYRMKRSLL